MPPKLWPSTNYKPESRPHGEFVKGGSEQMGELSFKTMRVAFQGEPGAFSEAAAIQLLGEEIRTVPRATFDATFRAIADAAADALLLPVENTLAGSVVRVYDLLLQSPLEICGETILPIEHHLMACPASPSSSFAPWPLTPWRWRNANIFSKPILR